MLSEQQKCTYSAITVFDSVFSSMRFDRKSQSGAIVRRAGLSGSAFSHCLLIFSHFLFAVSLFRFSYQILDGASEIIPILLTQAKF